MQQFCYPTAEQEHFLIHPHNKHRIHPLLTWVRHGRETHHSSILVTLCIVWLKDVLHFFVLIYANRPTRNKSWTTQTCGPMWESCIRCQA
jgi:hypothetical protein